MTSISEFLLLQEHLEFLLLREHPESKLLLEYKEKKILPGLKKEKNKRRRLTECLITLEDYTSLIEVHPRLGEPSRVFVSLKDSPLLEVSAVPHLGN